MSSNWYVKESCRFTCSLIMNVLMVVVGGEGSQWIDQFQNNIIICSRKVLLHIIDNFKQAEHNAFRLISPVASFSTILAISYIWVLIG